MKTLSIAFLNQIVKQFNPKIIIAKISRKTAESVRKELKRIGKDEVLKVLPNFNDIPVTLDYNHPGDHKVLFTKLL